MADLKENQMTEITDATHVRCMNGANSNIISMMHLLSLLFGGTNKINGVVDENTDWNTITNCGRYLVSGSAGQANGPNHPDTYGYGVLLVFKSGSFLQQIYFPHFGNGVSNDIAIRTIYYGNAGSWYYITTKAK